MNTKKKNAKEDSINYSLYCNNRKFLSDIAEKYQVDLNKLLIGMQYNDLVIQIYDEGAYPMWKTLEIIKF